MLLWPDTFSFPRFVDDGDEFREWARRWVYPIVMIVNLEGINKSASVSMSGPVCGCGSGTNNDWDAQFITKWHYVVEVVAKLGM